MGVGRNICISKICSTRFQFWSNPPPLFLFGLCKNLLPDLWPGSTSVQWRRRRRIWGKGLPLTRTHQQLVDLLPRVIPIHSFPLFLFCFFSRFGCFGTAVDSPLYILFSPSKIIFSGGILSVRKQFCGLLSTKKGAVIHLSGPEKFVANSKRLTSIPSNDERRTSR